MTDANLQMGTYDVSLSIGHDLRQLKHEGKIIDSHVNTFKKEAKQFVSTLCNHILSRSSFASCFALPARCLSSINLVVIPDTCEKRFLNLLQKLVDRKLITSLFAEEAKKEFHRFASDVVRENKEIFRNYNARPVNLDWFYMEYLKDSIH